MRAVLSESIFHNSPHRLDHFLVERTCISGKIKIHRKHSRNHMKTSKNLRSILVEGLDEAPGAREAFHFFSADKYDSRFGHKFEFQKSTTAEIETNFYFNMRLEFI